MAMQGQCSITGDVASLDAPRVSKEMSARRADYIAWTGAKGKERRPPPAGLEIGPCLSLDPLAEIRGALKGGLLVTYGINTVLTALSIPTALGKNLPVLFWAPKVLLLGGLAFDELNNAPEQPKKKSKKK